MNYTAESLSRFCALTFLILSGFLITHPSPLHAEPYLALRTGFKCSQCHVNISGGGKRTEFGNIYADQYLAAKFIKSPNTGLFSPKLSEYISFGANLRFSNTLLFGYADTTAGDVPDEVFMDIAEGNIYLEFNIIPEILTLYVDQLVSPEPGNRESFGLIQGLPLKSYFKFGKMLLPYGLRLWDDAAFIREETGFTYSDPDLAVEMGFEPGDLSVISAITLNQISGVASLVMEYWRIGISWQKSTETSKSRILGSFVGFHAGRFTLLGEVDQFNVFSIKQYAYLAELNFLLIRGHNFKISYNLFDRNSDIELSRDGQERIRFGLEIFPVQHIQFSIFYNVNRFIPQNRQLNQNKLVAELHVFF
ncbi:MAG: hypothetical protein IIB39_11130 [Candidatus Marinimicrobia bacterium]|nr:hypothetical protein [Candidatus Neomarinimicrobiota bacterium]